MTRQDNVPQVFISFYQLFALLFVSRTITMLSIAMLDNREVFNLQSALLLPVLQCLLVLAFLPVAHLNRNHRESLLQAAMQKNPTLGRVLGLLYAGYFFLIIVRSTWRFAHFIGDVLINDLPVTVFLGMIFFGAVFVATHGIEAMGRFATLIALLIGLISLLILFAVLPSLSWRAFEPLDLNLPQGFLFAVDYLGHSAELVALGLLASRGKGSFKKSSAAFLIATLVLAEIFILLPQAALGRYTYQLSFPFYELTTIPKQGIFQRMDAFYANIWIFGIIMQTALFLYLFELSLHTFSKGRHKRKIIIACMSGVALSLLAVEMADSGIVQFIFRAVVESYTALLLCVPLLLTWLLRRHPRENGKGNGIMKVTAVVLLLALTGGLLSGCDGSQTQSLLFVEALGIDKEEEDYLLTVQVFDPLHVGDSFQSQTGPITRLDSCKGETVMDALRNLTQSSGQRVSYSKNRLVIIGEEVAQEGLYQVLDYLLRTQEKRATLHVVVTKGKAADVVRATMNDSVTPALDMQRVLSNAQDYGLGMEMRLLDVMNLLLEGSSSLYIPAVKAVQLDFTTGKKEDVSTNKAEGKEQEGETSEQGSNSGGGGSEQGGSGGENSDGNKSISMEMDGLAVFEEDRLLTFLPQENVPGLLWLTGNGQHTTRTFSYGEGKRATAQTYRYQLRVIPDVSGAAPHFTFILSGSASLLGVAPYLENPYDEEAFTAIEEAYNREIAKECQEMWDKVIVEMGCDLLQLGRLLRGSERDYWQANQEQWFDILPQCTLEVQSDFSISNGGSTMGR